MSDEIGLTALDPDVGDRSLTIGSIQTAKKKKGVKIISCTLTDEETRAGQKKRVSGGAFNPKLNQPSIYVQHSLGLFSHRGFNVAIKRKPTLKPLLLRRRGGGGGDVMGRRVAYWIVLMCLF